MPLSPLSRRCLLVVEDDDMVREIIILLLEEHYELRVAVSVSTALAHLHASDGPPIDLMLLDCLLPGGNLADVLAEADLQSIPAVLISGDPKQAERTDPTRLFLPKPFTRAELLSTLETARR